MPNHIVMKLMDQVTELEKKVAILMSWHKVQVALLGIILTAVLALFLK